MRDGITQPATTGETLYRANTCRVVCDLGFPDLVRLLVGIG